MAGSNRCLDDNSSDSGVTDHLIVNEFLTSVKHAIDTGKSASDIAPSFVLFYKDADIKSAHEALTLYIGTLDNLNVKLSARSRKIDKEDAKLTDVKNIVEAIRQIDWKGVKFPFVASEITKVCFVYGNLRDKLQMRSEMHRINTRLTNLEDLLKSIPSLGNRIDSVINSIKLTPPPTPSLEDNPKTSGFTYKDKLTANNVVTPTTNIGATPSFTVVKDKNTSNVKDDNSAQTPWKTVLIRKKT